MEGRYDKNALLQVVDATVVETGGFGVFNDKEKLAFHQTVRQSYLRLQQRHPARIKLIDASQPLPTVINDVKTTIHDRFSELF